MFQYVWPIGLVVLSNVLYQICTKEVPLGMNAFASLTLTYLVGAVVSALLFFALGKGQNLFAEMAKTNWAPLVLGIVIVGLEVGYIFAFKNGWQVSMAAIVQGSMLAILLIFVGFWLYKEELSWNKLVGIAFCLVGLGFINFKK